MQTTSKPTQLALAIRYGTSLSTINRWQAAGAPVDGDAAKLLNWWRGHYPKGVPPVGLTVAAAAGPPESKRSVPRVSAIPPEEVIDIFGACVCQRKNIAVLQRRLEAAQERDDHVRAERWARCIDRATFALARLEKVAKEVRRADELFVPVDSVREVWGRFHRHLSNTLFAVAAKHSTNLPALKKAWHTATAPLRADLFPPTPQPL